MQTRSSRWSTTGWHRLGTKGAFRYVDRRGREITDPAQLARIRSLAVPPAWTDVWISPDPTANLQATGVDAAGRRQYHYHPAFRHAREQAKFEKLGRFAEMLPVLRTAMTEHMDAGPMDRERVASVALRLIDHGWFRVGGEKYLQREGTYGITTLRKDQVAVHAPNIEVAFVGKRHKLIRKAVVDSELATAIRHIKGVPGGPRLFRYRWEDDLHNLTSARLNGYIHRHAGNEFSAKDFRTWGGTLTAAIAFAARGPVASPIAQKHVIAAVMREVGEALGNTPAVARASYVSPAVIDSYLEGQTIRDVRPRHIRVIGARDDCLSPEEVSLMALISGWRRRDTHAA
jgi:DNA topoisomerase-1